VAISYKQTISETATLVTLARSDISRGLYVAAAFTLLAVFVSVHLLHNSYGTYALDLGLFTQTLRYTLQGDILYTTIDQASHFGDHFSPILLLLIPAYWLFPYAQTLLVIQALGLGLGVYLAYMLARSFGLSHRASLGIEVLFAINPLLWGLVMFDFHPEALAIPALLAMFYGLKTGKNPLFYTGFIVALLTKETIIVTLGILGFAMMLASYVKHKTIDRKGLLIFTTSLAVYGIAVLVAFAASGWEVPKMLQYTDVRYGYLNDPLGVAISTALGNIFSIRSLFMLLAYLMPLGFLPLFAPIWAVPGFFILLANMLSTCGNQYQHFQQYAAPALPFLYFAFLQVLPKVIHSTRFQAIKNKLTPRLGIYLYLAMLLIGISYIISPAGGLKDTSWPDEHDRSIDRVVSYIPDGATVTAPNKIFPHLCVRAEVYLPQWFSKDIEYSEEITWGYPERETEYVIVDWFDKQIYDNKNFWQDVIRSTIRENYGTVIVSDGVELLKLR